jgi:hypothetical protein
MEFGTTQPPLNDFELVEAYGRGEAPGEEIMTRLLDRVGLSDRAQEILYKEDGSKLTGPEGQDLRAVDYLVVARQHGHAEQSILNFVRLDESHPKYDSFKQILTGSILSHLPPKKPGEA